jgi:serine/threonine-protein kinase
LLSSDDQIARLADFGLLAALDGSQLANAMMEIRTPNEVAYLAPEQVTPGAFVDESADLYALGAVLFTMLTGKPPFVAGTTAEVLDEILSGGRPPRPSALNEDVDEPLERIVQKLLARQPEDRYQSPAELLEELRPVMAEWNEGE